MIYNVMILIQNGHLPNTLSKLVYCDIDVRLKLKLINERDVQADSRTDFINLCWAQKEHIIIRLYKILA
jgi:hypothetical protein